MKKKEWVEVRVWRTGKYPRRCTRIRFEMIADGSQCDAVKTLMSYLDIGRYSFAADPELVAKIFRSLLPSAADKANVKNAQKGG